MTLPSGRRRRRRTGPSTKTVRLIRDRDNWACVHCGCDAIYAAKFRGLTTQHRKARGMGGTTDPAINSPSNLITLCGSGTTGCHGWVEDNPTQAHQLGLAVWSHEDPLQVPVHTRQGWRLLDNDGLAVPTGPPASTTTGRHTA